MLITEFRITMPMDVAQYQVGMLYGVAKASMEETGGGEGVEVLKNESYEDGEPLLNGRFTKGQYTDKIYHLESKVPAMIRYLAPTGSLKLTEKAWNCSDYCRTVITNPGYMKENFTLKIETMCVPEDRGDKDNVHELSAEQLKMRKVERIDIANDPIPSGDPNVPGRTQITKADPPIGPLSGNWRETVTPVMTVYKLITLEFKWWGVQTKVESLIMSQEEMLFNRLHRQIYCWMNTWHGMTLEDIRALEDKTKAELEEARNTGEVRGIKL